MNDDRLKAELVGALQQMSNQSWETVALIIRVVDGPNKKYELLPNFKDIDGRAMPIFLRPDAALQETLNEFIFREGDSSVTEVSFKVTRDQYIDASLVVRRDWK